VVWGGAAQQPGFASAQRRCGTVSSDEVRQAVGSTDLAVVVLETDGTLSVISRSKVSDGSALVDVTDPHPHRSGRLSPAQIAPLARTTMPATYIPRTTVPSMPIPFRCRSTSPAATTLVRRTPRVTVNSVSGPMRW
jgi:hypothetical protein